MDASFNYALNKHYVWPENNMSKKESKTVPTEMVTKATAALKQSVAEDMKKKDGRIEDVLNDKDVRAN